MKFLLRLAIIFSLASPILLAQDAVNPCAIDTETIDCNATGGEDARIKLHKIKLNGKRKDDPVVPANQDLTISAKLKYTKRGKAIITTTFTGGCDDRVEEKRIKPDVPVTYTAILYNGVNTTNYNGTGLEFTIPYGDITVANPELNVTFNVTGTPDCIDLANSTTSTNEHFYITVDDGAFTGTITVYEDLSNDDIDYTDAKAMMPTVVNPGQHYMRNRGIQLELNATFSSLSNTPYDPSAIQWKADVDGSVPSGSGNKGSFIGAENGPTVLFKQGDLEYGQINFTAKLTVDNETYTEVFPVLIFHIEAMDNVKMGLNETRDFVVPEANIHPNIANKALIAALLGQPENIGSKIDGIRLRTREYTAPSLWGNLNSEAFTPSELSQFTHISRRIKRALYKHVGNTLVLELESRGHEGTFNVTWEMKRKDHNDRRFLHRARVEVVDEPVPPTLSIVKQGTNDIGPFIIGVDDTRTFQAFSSTNIWTNGTGPTWTLEKPATSALINPNSSSDIATLQFDKPGLYKLKASDAGGEVEISIEVHGIDLAIDSDNTNGDAEPDISPTEDANEDIASDPANPGKILNANTHVDIGIPGFALGFEHLPTCNWEQYGFTDFTPVILTIPEPTDLSVAKVTINYLSSDPMSDSTCTSNVAWPTCTLNPGTGNRLWLKKGGDQRNGNNIPTGDFIASGTYTAAELGFDLSPGGKRYVPLYFEGLRGSNDWGDVRIEVTLDHDGDTGTSTPDIDADAVRATIVDVQIDSNADIRSFYGANPDDGLETLNVSVWPPLALTSGSIKVEDVQKDAGTIDDHHDDETGNVEWRQDPGSAWTDTIASDDDTTYEMRAHTPGFATLEVTYSFGTHNIQQTVGLSVPQFYEMDWTVSSNGKTFEDDLTYIGLLSAPTGNGPTQLTNARKIAIQTQVQNEILAWAYHRFDGDVNVRFVGTAPTFIPEERVFTSQIGGEDTIADKNLFGVTHLWDKQADGTHNNIWIEVFTDRHAHQKHLDDTSRFEATRTTPLNNSDYDVGGNITRQDVLNTILEFTRTAGDTFAHEAGHALYLKHHDSDGNYTNNHWDTTGDLMDSGTQRTWGIRRSAATGFSTAYKALIQKKHPTKTYGLFK